ncbi:MAG: restriction endonuclease [Flavobacteriaceae bacterium]
MPIPTYQQLLRPILAFAAKDPITRRSANVEMCKEMQLTEEEQKRLLPSGGSTYIANRVGWAMTFLTKAGLIEKAEKYTYRITERGKEFLERYPVEIKEADLKTIEGYKEAWETKRKKDDDTTAGSDESESTPEELIGSSISKLEKNLQSELLDQLANVDPYRFEQIVIDLLFSMGYGGSREEAAKVTQKSNDEGIDGIINEDRLGLDVIYVQAKRWQSTIGRKEIQSFVGALAGKQANKGIFITTSSFADSAIKYAETVQQKVILIDGERLTELMIEHNVGVSTTRTILMKRVDSDYFEDT